MKYIPVKKEDLKDPYINLCRLMGFTWADIFGVIGGRGYGKTYGFKRLCVKDFIYKQKKMIIIRDTIEACQTLTEANGAKCFGDVFSIEKNLAKHEYSINGLKITIDNKYAGEIMPLNAFYKYKGNYYDAENIFFDEFIPEQIQQYRGNRARAFSNTIETITRDRKARVMLSANALDMGNDLLELFGIHIKNGKYGFYLNKAKKVVIYYAPDSEAFENRKANSISGRLTKGTFLDASMSHNLFDEGECDIFETRDACDLYGIYYNFENECFRLYKAKKSNIYYVCKDINPNSYNYMRYVFKSNQLKPNREFADKSTLNFLKRILYNKQVKFESKYLFGVYCSIINKTLKK